MVGFFCAKLHKTFQQLTFLPLQAPDVTLILSTPIIMSISIRLISILKHLHQMTSVYIVAQTEIAQYLLLPYCFQYHLDKKCENSV